MNDRLALLVLPLSLATIVAAVRLSPREAADTEPAKLAARPVAEAYAAIEIAEARHEARFAEAADPAAAKQARAAALAQAYATKQGLAEIGAELFVRDFAPSAQKQMAETTRCMSCHHRGGPGGAGGLVDTFYEARNPPALWGAALLEQAGAERRVKPFGRGKWATIDEAVREMAKGAMSVELTAEEAGAIAAFVRSLPAPVIEPPDPARFPDLFDRFVRGRASFERLGCASCHVPEIPLADGRRVMAYTDLRAHDVGGGAMLTAPLWGLAASAPWLSDGRALASLDRAILLHEREAKPARDAFEKLPETGKAEIRVFLLSLTPEPKMQVAGK